MLCGHNGPVATIGSVWTGNDSALATAFDERAVEYARHRPGYPAAAVDAALPAGARLVLDLAAGTGKLTAAILDRGVPVIAVEPLRGMLAELHRLFPDALAVAGSAEAVPVRADAVDAVLVGQAFHWFQAPAALAETARVLRPGGTLALLWNHDDEADPMVRDVQDALARAGRPVGGSTRRGPATADAARGSTIPPFRGHPSFTDPVLAEFSWQRLLTVDELIGLVRTYSYVIRSSAQTREALDARLKSIVDAHRPSAGTFPMPAFCQVWQSTCR